MNVSVSSVNQGVELTVTDGDYSESCIIVGLSESEVSDQQDEFIQAHGLAP